MKKKSIETNVKKCSFWAILKGKAIDIPFKSSLSLMASPIKKKAISGKASAFAEKNDDRMSFFVVLLTTNQTNWS